MDYTKEKIVEMTGTDIAEHGNWIKDLDSKNDFMGADTFLVIRIRIKNW